MTLTEIARALALNRSSAFRLVHTLREMGFLKKAEPSSSYALGARVLNLGFAYLSQQSIISIARPHLEHLRDRTGVSAHLSVLEGHEVLYLDCLQARSSFVSNTTTGSRTTAYASPVGWCLLGSKSGPELDALYASEAFHPKTRQTPRHLDDLKKRIRSVLDDGYVISRGLYESGGSSVAAPLLDNTGRIVAAADVSGPDSGFDFARLDSFYVPSVTEAARKISAELGYPG